MKMVGAGLTMLLLLGLCGTLFVGCRPAPPCETSLVTLDETRLDAETYEQEAAETGKKVADLEQRLTQKNGEIDKIKDIPEELEKKVREMKKGSGRE
jgi:TolA-binding protein